VSKFRNISGGDLQVSFLDLRTVKADEVVELPDFQPAHNPDSKPGDPDYYAIVWPTDKWQPVSDAPKTGKAAV
jgi:hypothetical protein